MLTLKLNTKLSFVVFGVVKDLNFFSPDIQIRERNCRWCLGLETTKTNKENSLKSKIFLSFGMNNKLENPLSETLYSQGGITSRNAMLVESHLRNERSTQGKRVLHDSDLNKNQLLHAWPRGYF
ncbi:hypothetical protein CEXT_203681 [Caerostris extrusa]|uniref:Uncharacterized protein n=1 Tax=Caerostris extrusa TaxID=172846 RepID=A0AAV4XCR6_CAEEX|nr:hypothetical protein CEXT_203681 [Caerostris extrusa]